MRAMVERAGAGLRLEEDAGKDGMETTRRRGDAVKITHSAKNERESTTLGGLTTLERITEPLLGRGGAVSRIFLRLCLESCSRSYSSSNSSYSRLLLTSPRLDAGRVAFTSLFRTVSVVVRGVFVVVPLADRDGLFIQSRTGGGFRASSSASSAPCFGLFLVRIGESSDTSGMSSSVTPTLLLNRLNRTVQERARRRIERTATDGDLLRTPRKRIPSD